MNKGIKILIGILVIGIVLAGGWWVWNNYYKVSETSEIYREELMKEISDKIEKLDKSCQSNEDCKEVELRYLIKADGVHPLCVNKEETIKEIRSLQDLYYKKYKTSLPDILINLLPFYGCECKNNVCAEITKKAEEVTITTDKTEYEQGETVKIVVKNNLDKSICFGTCNNYYFEKKNGEWKYYLKKFCEADFIKECIKPNETKIFERETIWNSYKIEKGTYRMVIPLCIDCENLGEFREDKVIFSNEFTIKEK